MPEQPNEKLYTGSLIEPPQKVASCDINYAELDVTTNYSFLRGASHPDELVYTAALLGYRALAITDINSVAGVVRAYEAARKVAGFKLVIGTRLMFVDGTPDVLAWPSDRAAYGRLCQLLTLGRRRAIKGECHLTLADLLSYCEGLQAALVVPPCSNKELRERFAMPAETLRNAMGDRLSLAASICHDGEDEPRLKRLAAFSREFHVPLLATNHVHYHDPGRRPLQDVLTCTRHGCTLEEAGHRLFPNAERYLKSPEQMRALFCDYPKAIDRAVEVAKRCTFSLGEIDYIYPDDVTPAGEDPSEHLRALTLAGAARRYQGKVPYPVKRLLVKELKLIYRSKYEPYFLTVYDIVRYARSRRILCQGRGSAANSAVCFCLGVTSVDPVRFQLVFSRFISESRDEPPDIDIDFEHERREEVIQYVYEKYGRDRAAMTASLITYRGRSAIRDVGKALGFDSDALDAMAGKLDWWHKGVLTPTQLAETGLDSADRMIQRLLELATELLGFPRHLSQHVGGMVISRCPLGDIVPIENASMADRTVIEWDKDDLDVVAMFKIDILALGMLTAIAKGIDFVNQVGTKARRHEGTKGKMVRSDDDDSDASRSHCVAEGDAASEVGLSIDANDDSRGTVWIDESDETSISLDSFEHRGRLRDGEPAGILTPSQDREGLAGGTVHTMDAVRGTAVAQVRSITHRLARRSRSPSSRSHPLTSTKELAHPFVPSCLRAFVALELLTIPWEIPAVYEMISDADTIGVFQVESRAQMSMLPRLKPKEFYDLVVEVAIVRPGPIQGDMVHPYLLRREALNRDPNFVIEYAKPELETVLKKTLGVPLFQEQAMQMSIVAAGFSESEADQLRRGMAAWKRSEGLGRFHDKFINGMIERGYQPDFAERCFDQIKGFGSYGFPESHAASFARLVYASAWLKRFHPAAFCAGLVNSYPMGFYAPAQLVIDARNHGVTVNRVDVNTSEWDCTLEQKRPDKNDPPMDQTPTAVRSDGACSKLGSLRAISIRPHSGRRSNSSSSDKRTWGLDGPALRLGFRLVKGFRLEDAERIVAERKANGPFTSVEEFHRRTGLTGASIRRLAEADAFSSLKLSRRPANWHALAIGAQETPIIDVTQCRDEATPELLPTMPAGQEVLIDYATTGLSLKRHPVAFARGTLAKEKVITAAALRDDADRYPHGTWVKVAGLVLVRQRPGTASGVVFMSMEDETGIANLIIWSHVYDRYRPAARHATLLLAEGFVQREGKVVHVLAKRMHDRSNMLGGLHQTSRDFH